MTSTSPDRLSCGRDIDDVWARIDDEPDAHELGCPYCLDARAHLQDLAEVTTSATAEDRSDPALQLHPGAAAAIADVVRSEVRRGRRLPLQQPGTGPDEVELTVSEQTLATVVRRAADQVDGLEARRCQVELDPDEPQPVEPDIALAVPASDAAPVPARIVVQLAVAVGRGVSAPAMSDLLRHRVIDTVSAVVGLTVAAVHITVEDVLDV